MCQISFGFVMMGIRSKNVNFYLTRREKSRNSRNPVIPLSRRCYNYETDSV